MLGLSELPSRPGFLFLELDKRHLPPLPGAFLLTGGAESWHSGLLAIKVPVDFPHPRSAQEPRPLFSGIRSGDMPWLACQGQLIRDIHDAAA